MLISALFHPRAGRVGRLAEAMLHQRFWKSLICGPKCCKVWLCLNALVLALHLDACSSSWVSWGNGFVEGAVVTSSTLGIYGGLCRIRPWVMWPQQEWRQPSLDLTWLQLQADLKKTQHCNSRYMVVTAGNGLLGQMSHAAKVKMVFCKCFSVYYTIKGFKTLMRHYFHESYLW